MSSPDPAQVDALAELVAKVIELKSSVEGLTEAMTTERKRRDKQRTKDWVANVLLLLALGLGGGAWLYSQSNAHSACEATNEANQTIHDLFAPLNVFTPTVITPRMTPDEVTAAKVADAKRKVATDAFFADLNERTQARQC